MPTTRVTSITQLHHPTLSRIIPFLWLLIVGGLAGLFIYSIPLQYESFRTSPRYAVGYADALRQIGMSAEFYAGYFAVIDTIQAGAITAISLLVFARRRDDWMALLISASVFVASICTIPALHAVLEKPVSFLAIFANSGVVVALFLFPDGSFKPRWTRWLTPLVMLLPFIGLGIILNQDKNISFALTPITLSQSVFQIIGIGAQVWRYRRISNPSQRQQTKWIILGFALAVGFGLVYTFMPVFFPALTTPSFEGADAQYTVPSLLWQMIGVALVIIGLTAIPVSIALSIIRYRLWDIDLTINRSLVTAGVTLVLAAIFGVVFLVVQALLRGIFNAGDELAVATAGILVGVTFNPTRNRVRRFVDRNLYGFRFDLNQAKRNQDAPTVDNPGILTGKNMGAWRLHGVIGRGGMGEVYQATMANGDMAAIKILLPDLVAKSEVIERFTREAEIALRLRHPHIVQTLGSGTSEGQYYIALDYIAGDTLKDALKKREVYPLAEACAILKPIADALDFAHAQGFVHRDLKPSNIMLRDSGDGNPHTPILMDFGVAKIIGGTTLTGSGAVGTIEYMAPEQIISSRTIDTRADIYALGVLAYELLTGKPPFHGNVGQILFNQLQQPPPDPRTLIPDLPKSASAALLKALAKTPDERQATATAFITELASV